MTCDNNLILELIICTKNGGARLARCLNAVSNADQDEPFLVHIVDNGSTDGHSAEIARKFANSLGDRCRFSVETRPGNSAGRNKALNQLRGTYAIFVDDDCYIRHDFIRAWAAVFRSASPGYGGGTILPFEQSNSLLGCFVSDQSEIFEGGAFIKRGSIQGSNMFFSAACLRDIGLFDPNFGAGTAFAGEEWDLALTASKAGWKGGYFAEPTVYHDHGRGEGEAKSRIGFYDYGAGAVYAKHIKQRDRDAFKKFLSELRYLPISRKIDLLSGSLAYITKGSHR